MAILLWTLSQLDPKLLMATLVARRRLLTTLIRLSVVPGLQLTLLPTMILGLLTIVHTTLRLQARTSIRLLLPPMDTRQLHQRGRRRHQNFLATGLMRRHLEGHQRHTVDNRRRQLGAVMMGQGMRMVHPVHEYVQRNGGLVRDGALGS